MMNASIKFAGVLLSGIGVWPVTRKRSTKHCLDLRIDHDGGEGNQVVIANSGTRSAVNVRLAWEDASDPVDPEQYIRLSYILAPGDEVAMQTNPSKFVPGKSYRVDVEWFDRKCKAHKTVAVLSA